MVTGVVVVAGTFTLLGGMLARRAQTVNGRRAQRQWPYALCLLGLTHLLVTFFSGAGLWISSLIAFALAIRMAGESSIPAEARSTPGMGPGCLE